MRRSRLLSREASGSTASLGNTRWSSSGFFSSGAKQPLGAGKGSRARRTRILETADPPRRAPENDPMRAPRCRRERSGPQHTGRGPLQHDYRPHRLSLKAMRRDLTVKVLGLFRHRLLRKAGGFERLGMAEVIPRPNHASIFQLVDMAGGRGRRYNAARTASMSSVATTSPRYLIGPVAGRPISLAPCVIPPKVV